MSHPEQGRPTDPTAGHERPGGYDEDPRQNVGVPEQVRHSDEQQAYDSRPGGAGHPDTAAQQPGAGQYDGQHGGEYAGQYGGQHDGQYAGQYGGQQVEPAAAYGDRPGGGHGEPAGQQAGQMPPQQYDTAPGQAGQAPGGPGVGGQPGAYPGPPEHGRGAPGRPAGDAQGGYPDAQAGHGDAQAGHGGAQPAAHDGTTPDAGDGRQPAEYGTIFDPDRASQWRAQWEDVRMMFVDRPQDAAARADGLVGEVLGELSRTFTEQRSALDPQVLGGEPSTEELRRAVQRYREFFDRLLTL
ncbi:hypothetical protein ACR9E3_23535 [Actinomycetospora sp. C-140]